MLEFFYISGLIISIIIKFLLDEACSLVDLYRPIRIGRSEMNQSEALQNIDNGQYNLHNAG